MPITRCSNCGTEERMLFNSTYFDEPAAAHSFLFCSKCDSSVCHTCFVVGDNACGQCVEAKTNGLQEIVDMFDMNLTIGLSINGPSALRQIKLILIKACKGLEQKGY